MALQIEQQTRDIGVVRTTLGPERTRVVVRPGDAFRFVDDSGAPLVRAPRLRVRRLDNNLIVDGLPDGRELELNNFFGACRPGAECTVSLAGIGLPGAVAITEETPPTAALQDGSFLLYSDNTDAAALAALPAAKVAEAGGPSWLAIGGAAAGIGIAAAAAGGGGGGGSGGPVEDTTPPGAPVITSGAVLKRSAALVTGEAEPGARITLRVDVNGNGVFSDPGDLTFVTTVGADGRWQVDLNGTPQSGTPPAGGLVDGSYAILAVATDAAQNASPATRSTATLDGAPPAAPVITAVAGDFAVNAAELAAGIVASGTAEAGSSVVVALGGVSVTTTASASGAWSATLPAGQPALSGFVPITVAAVDAVGNASASTTRQVLFETVAPGAPVITDNVPGTATGPVTFTLTFDKPISGFTASDVQVTGGTPGAFTQVSTSVYTLVVTPLAATQSGQITLTVPAGAGTDAVGNPTVAGAAIQGYDTAAPAVAITNNAPASPPPNSAVLFTFTFSEAVTGFDATDITLSPGATVAAFAGSGTTYTAQILPPAGATGNLTVGVAAGVAVDAVLLPNTAAANSVVAFDRQAPTLAPITDSVAGTAGPAGVVFTFTFSEPVSGFGLADIALTGAQPGEVLTAFTAVSPTVYTATYVPTVAGTSGTATVAVATPLATITDASGNPYAGSVSVTQTYDRVAPTVVAITDAVAGTANGPVAFTFTFSEAIDPATFTAADIALSAGATAGPVVAVGAGGTVFTSTITPPSGSGTFTVGLPAGAVTDVAGNPSAASATVSQAFAPPDLTPPSVVITDDREAPGVTVVNLANPTVTFTFTFSEAIQTGATGEAFLIGDITPISGAGTGSFGALTRVDAQTYTLQYTASAADAPASLGITVGTSRYADLEGNFNTTTASRTQAYDLQAPTVAITDSFTSTTVPTNAPVTFTFTTSEATTDFTAADVTVVSGGTAGAFTPVSATVYTLVVTPTPNSAGSIRVDAVADAFRDAAGNPSVTASRQQSYDTQAPAQSVTAAQLTETPGGAVVPPGGTSTDSTPRLTITLGGVLAFDETLQIFRDGGATVVGSFAGGTVATSFTYNEATSLGAGPHSYSARLIDDAGNIRALDLDLVAPGTTDPYTFTI